MIQKNFCALCTQFYLQPPCSKTSSYATAPNDAHHPLCTDGDISLGKAIPRADGSHDQAQVVEALNRDSIKPAVTKLMCTLIPMMKYTTKR